MPPAPLRALISVLSLKPQVTCEGPLFHHCLKIQKAMWPLTKQFCPTTTKPHHLANTTCWEMNMVPTGLMFCLTPNTHPSHKRGTILDLCGYLMTDTPQNHATSSHLLGWLLSIQRSQQGCGEIRTLGYCLWEGQIVQPLWESVWRFLRKFKKIVVPYPTIPLLGIYSKQLKAGTQIHICTPLFTAALFTIA